MQFEIFNMLYTKDMAQKHKHKDKHKQLPALIDFPSSQASADSSTAKFRDTLRLPYICIYLYLNVS